MCKTARIAVAAVSLALACALGFAVSETARLSRPLDFAAIHEVSDVAAPYVRGYAAVPVNAREFDSFAVPDGSVLSLRLVPSDGGNPAILFAVFSGACPSALRVDSVSLGGSDALGLFLGHGCDLDNAGGVRAVWCAYEVAPVPDGSALSVSVTGTNADGSSFAYHGLGASHAL